MIQKEWCEMSCKKVAWFFFFLSEVEMGEGYIAITMVDLLDRGRKDDLPVSSTHERRSKGKFCEQWILEGSKSKAQAGSSMAT